MQDYFFLLHFFNQIKLSQITNLSSSKSSVQILKCMGKRVLLYFRKMINYMYQVVMISGRLVLKNLSR